MSPIKRNKAIRSLKKKGFQVTDGKHKSLALTVEGKREFAAVTHVSHGGNSTELSEFHIRQMGKQLNLSLQECKDLINCPMDTEQYVEILRGRGLLE